ncbi:hypothetical protein GDO78_001722 [Eleutherodactylus coqui]|uniref:Uncharacterized protein n=1 Tax=Eleutherodactylus coqui TaxID=57060 RepID=A0A8J6FSU0_ELECQ|nr:hypothetical protein GDO78_001722 [Eleutherodactylus coqui]
MNGSMPQVFISAPCCLFSRKAVAFLQGFTMQRMESVITAACNSCGFCCTKKCISIRTFPKGHWPWQPIQGFYTLKLHLHIRLLLDPPPV